MPNSFTQQVESYKKKIQASVKPTTQETLCIDSNKVFADLLQDYLAQYPGENFFAVRLNQKLDKPNFNLLAKLNQYCDSNHHERDVAKRRFML